MSTIIIASFLISLLHALSPSHWLPVLAIGRKENWSLPQTIKITFIAGLAHVVSTVIIGFILGYVGASMQAYADYFTRLVAPGILILLGFYFIQQHYKHHHFHLNEKKMIGRSTSKIIWALVIAMFLSPCMEIEAYFFLAGTYGFWFSAAIAFMYAVVTLTGMMIWITVAYKGMLKLNWHSLEHNAGIITGGILIITGIITFFIH